VALVVHVKAVLDRVILEIRHEASDVDNRQVVKPLSSALRW
jgi:hypothetical protein